MASDASPPNHTITAQSTDVELLNALKAGQIHALSALYDRYASLVYRMALRVLHDSEEAEDLTQDVFLRLWNQADRYDASRGSLSSYLLTITRSRAIDKLRSRGSQLRFFHRWKATLLYNATPDTPLESISMEERSQLVRAALSSLSDNERQILELSYYEGLSYTEMAKRLNLPLGTVKSRARAGLRKLRHALKHSL